MWKIKKILQKFIINKGIFCFLFLLFLWAFPNFAQATSLSFVPSSGPYFVGDKFSVTIFVSSSDQAMNAVSADISFSQERLELLSISQSGSIIGFWAQEPVYSNQSGDIFFEGVVLNGYQGTAGKIVTLSFRARASGQASLRFSSGAILANDGMGTEMPSNFGSARFNIGVLEEVEALPIPSFEIPPGFEFTKDLNVPNRDIEVAYLQICLRQEEIYTGEVTGIFDSTTRDAVIEYQEKYFDDILAPWGFTRGTGLIRQTTRDQLNRTCFIPTEAPEQLFDITLELDDDSFAYARDLAARVIFFSFGTVPTPVDLTFKILDSAGDEIYVSEDETTVIIEAVFNKKFQYLDLPIGDYTLELTTLYDIDVEDKFYADFEITGIEKDYYSVVIKYWIWLVVFFVVIVILLFIILMLLAYQQYRYIQEKEDVLSNINKRLSILGRRSNLGKVEQALLRRLQKDLVELERKAQEYPKRKRDYPVEPGTKE